jgi:putative hydrolase of the HAD superfamily
MRGAILKAVTVDLDNTLIDFIRMKKYAAGAAAQAMVRTGLRMREERARNELFRFYLETNIEGNDIFERFLKRHKALSERTMAAALNAYLSAKIRAMKPYPDVRSTLRKLKRNGLKLAILTDAPRLKAYQRLDAMGLADEFDAVVGFEDTAQKKPSPLPFGAALRKLDVGAVETLHVGDWPERDIAGAQAIGMKTAWAKYGAERPLPPGVVPDYTLDAFSDLSTVAVPT